MAMGAAGESSGMIVPFKRPVYERVVREFAKFVPRRQGRV